MHIHTELVIAGDHRVVEVRIIKILDLLDMRQRRERALAAERLPHLLRGMRQEWSEQVVRVRHGLRGHMQHGGEMLLVILDLPRFGGGNVLVDTADHAHRLIQRILLVVALNQPANHVEGRRRLLEQRTVLGGHRILVEPRNRTEVLIDEVGDTVDQIAPAGGELLIVVPHEFGPREIGIRGFRAGHGDVVAHGVHRVACKNILHVDHDAARGAELLAFHSHELAGHDLLRQVERAELAGLATL